MVEAPIEVDGNPGNCNGTMIEQNYVYDTLASGHQTVATDNFVVDWAFSQGDDPEVQYTVTANRGPRLLVYINNTFIDVTGQTSTVAIGQDTGAVADYYDYIATGTTLSSASYTANGTRVQSYTPSATACNSSVPCPMILPNSYAGATPYAYTAPGSYSQSWNFTTSDGGSGSVSTNFNAVGPTDANVQTTTNAVMLLTQAGSPFLQMGNYNADLYGITFLGSANDPPGYTGTLTWVQVVRKLSYTNIKANPVIAQTCIAPAGLDSQYPYDAYPGPNVNDSPSFPLNSTMYSKEAPSESFTMYLLWSPPSALVPVPLGYVNWSWSASSAFANSMWSLTSSDSGPVSAFVASSAYPQWNAIVQSGSVVYSCN